MFIRLPEPQIVQLARDAHYSNVFSWPAPCTPVKLAAMNAKIFLNALSSIALVGICCAQSSDSTSKTAPNNIPYTEGPVWTLTMIKTKAGLDDDHFRQITGTAKPVYDEDKKQKIIIDNKILTGDSIG